MSAAMSCDSRGDCERLSFHVETCHGWLFFFFNFILKLNRDQYIENPENHNIYKLHI